MRNLPMALIALVTLATLATLAGCAGTQAAEPAPVTFTSGVCPTCGRGPIVGIPDDVLNDQPSTEPHWMPTIWIDESRRGLAPAPEPPEALPEDEALERARVGGKYTELLRKIEVPGDHVIYGAFHDYGPWSGPSWGGHDDLPPGQWVYVYPHWYIWK